MASPLAAVPRWLILCQLVSYLILQVGSGGAFVVTAGQYSKLSEEEEQQQEQGLVDSHDVSGPPAAASETAPQHDNDIESVDELHSMEEPVVVEEETIKEETVEPEDDQRENGILVVSPASPMESITEFMRLNNNEEEGRHTRASVLLALVDTVDCSKATQQHTLRAWEEAAHKIEQELEESPPMAKMDLESFHFILKQQGEKQIAVERVPLVAVFEWKPRTTTRQPRPQIISVVENFDAPHQPHYDLFQSSLQLEGLFWHYFTRIVLMAEYSIDPPPIVQHEEPAMFLSYTHLERMELVKQLTCQFNDKFFHSVPAPLPPTLSLEEEELRRKLWTDVERDMPDDFVVFVQCRKFTQRKKHSGYQALYKTFYQFSVIMAERQDVFFATTSDCEDDQDASVFSWKYAPSFHESLGNDTEVSPPCRLISSTFWSASASGNDPRSLIRAHQGLTTPSLAWFDPRLAAPMALSRDVQALLFVSLHPSVNKDSVRRNEEEDKVAALIREFRSYCQEWRRDNNVSNDMVCLLVPSTETRVLTTLGVDIWSPLDQHVAKQQKLNRDSEEGEGDDDEEPPPHVLPQLVLLDRRRNGETPLYRLRRPNSEQPMVDWINDFWQGKLSPELRSSAKASDEPVVNEHGVYKLSADAFASESFQSTKHSLILFLSPTCGHCKRAVVWFNQVSRILREAPGWRDLLTLYMVDVSKDHIPSVVVRWLPDLVYVSPEKEHVIQYNNKEQLAGEIAHYSRVLEWLLQHMQLENDIQWMDLLTDLQAQL